MAMQTPISQSKMYKNTLKEPGRVVGCGNDNCVDYFETFTGRTSGKLNDAKSYKSKPYLGPNGVQITMGKEQYYIWATGGQSDIEIVVMYGKSKKNKNRSHFGLLLTQSKSWNLQKVNRKAHERKCLFMHHMGTEMGVVVGVGCRECALTAIQDAYGPYGCDVCKDPRVLHYPVGISKAAVWRFLDETSMGYNAKLPYNNRYAKDKDAYYDWETSNCCRFTFDALFYLKLKYEDAKKITRAFSGDNKDDFNKIIDMFQGNKDYLEFAGQLVATQKNLRKRPQTQFIAQLLDNQYRMDLICVKYDTQMIFSAAFKLLSLFVQDKDEEGKTPGK